MKEAVAGGVQHVIQHDVPNYETNAAVLVNLFTEHRPNDAVI